MKRHINNNISTGDYSIKDIIALLLNWQFRLGDSIETSSQWNGITVKYRATLAAYDERTACLKITEKIRIDENGQVSKEVYKDEYTNLPIEYLEFFKHVF